MHLSDNPSVARDPHTNLNSFEEKDMTTLTMIWSDCHCDGNHHNWYQVTLPSTPNELRELNQSVIVALIVRRYYIMTTDVDTILVDIIVMIREALTDINVVAIFIGTPEEL